MAEFIVRLDKSAGSLSARYYYEFRSTDGGGPLEQEYMADPSPILVEQLCKRIDSIIRDALSAAPLSTDPAAELVQHGQFLYNALFPPLDGDIPDLARKLGGLREPLLLRSNESDIPWELLHDGTGFLGLTHRIGRRKFAQRRVVGGRGIGELGKALIIGDPNGNLPAARTEATDLAAWLGKHGVDCTLLLGEDANLLRVFQELNQSNYDLLHYCGHVAAPHGTSLLGLRLHEDKLMDARVLQPLAHKGTPPVVFINACDSASRVSDLCSSFAALGTKLAIGTLYEVAEEPARTFSERFYADLMEGETAGTAMRAARDALREHGVSWTAFLLYGDPSTRVTGDAPATQPETVVARPDSGRKFDRAAAELMTRVIEHAAPHSVVTSMDLLAELLSSAEIEHRMKQDKAGPGRLVLAGELLRSVLDVGPATPVAPGTEIEFSDTVEAALTRAEALAHDSGREEITVADLIAAFIAVGGGSSAQLLDLLGISLAELAVGDDAHAKIDAGPGPDPAAPAVAGHPSTNGHRPDVVGFVRDNGVGDVLFDDSGRLRTDRLAPDMVAAIRVAALLAVAQNTVISTGMLVYGLGIANNAFFLDRMRAQGEAGAVTLEKLSLLSETNVRRFSPRTIRALERAVGRAAEGPIPDAAILAELIAEQTSTARQLLVRFGIDPDRLLGETDPA
jgi:hypothetical protein